MSHRVQACVCMLAQHAGVKLRDNLLTYHLIEESGKTGMYIDSSPFQP